MLILQRRKGESIEIYMDGICIRVNHLGKGDAGRDKLGIEAPLQFRIDRSEVAERIRAGLPPPPKKIPVK